MTVKKKNWRILTNKEIYAMVKKTTITKTLSLNRLHWFGHVQRIEEDRFPKKVLYMNLETSRLRGRPRNGWHDEVREDGRLVGGKWWKESVYYRGMEEASETARNCHNSAHANGMNECSNNSFFKNHSQKFKY
jgi:hypothetical protein